MRTHLATIYRKLGASSKLDQRKRIEASPHADLASDLPLRPDITALRRSPWLFTIVRNTTVTYKGESVNVRRVAAELDVRFVLEGSVRRTGERVRVIAQLIDGHVLRQCPRRSA